MILERKHLVSRSLTEKLLTYGTGREPGFLDREEIEKIATVSLEEGKGLHDLVHAVVTSRIFRSR